MEPKAQENIAKDETEFESLHPEDIADELSKHKENFKNLLEKSEEHVFVYLETARLIGLGDTEYPYACSPVEGQVESACKLTFQNDLPLEIRDIYKIDYGLTNIYSRKDTLLMGVQACVFSHFGESGTVTVSGMSSRRFNQTRPNTSSSQHNKGRAFDIKLQGRMMTDGNKYDQRACAFLCYYSVEAGATRVIFSDQAVVDAVNEATGKNVCICLNNHRNHVHMDNR